MTSAPYYRPRHAQTLPGMSYRGAPMCGRYSLTDLGEALLQLFELPALPAGYRPRYNIAPTQNVTAIITREGERRAGDLRWGLIPSWAKEASIGNRMINARAETIAEKPAFRRALRQRRCLIPADGFYEWQVRNGRKQPVRFVAADDGLFAFAGLWESWRPGVAKGASTGSATASESPEKELVIYSCAIVTTDANDFVRPVHHRMPVIIAPDAYDVWLDPKVQDPEAVLPLLRSVAEDALRVYDVSTLVNAPRNEVPECIEPQGQV